MRIIKLVAIRAPKSSDNRRRESSAVDAEHVKSIYRSRPVRR